MAQEKEPEGNLRILATFLIGISVGICMAILWQDGLSRLAHWIARR